MQPQAPNAWRDGEQVMPERLFSDVHPLTFKHLSFSREKIDGST
jgi:hypothetical protein